MPKMQGRWVRALALATGFCALAIGATTPAPALASSHREAPLIAEDPLADPTDVYAFRSPDKQDTVTFVANFVPFQQPAGGPNFYRFGDDVLYQIHVDNVGDGRPHITFNYRFTTKTNNPNTFLYDNVPPVGPITCSGHTYRNWNRPQSYTLSVSRDGYGDDVIARDLITPPSQVGPKVTPNYDRLAACATYNSLPGGISSFAGQRDDPFYADLGRIFDLIDVGSTPHVDYLAGLNVNSIVLRVPIQTLQGPNPNDHVIGVWATTSRQQLTLRTSDGAKRSFGAWTQVGRLGNPLVNEVVIPLGKKDRFNASRPQDDGQFLSFVKRPELSTYLNALFDKDVPVNVDRPDLVTTFLTGIKAIGNQPARVSASEQLRLNMATPVTHTNPNEVNRLGALGEFLSGKAPEGYPNGRRLGDDAVDISVLAVAGVLCQPSTAATLGFQQCRNSNVNLGLGDGVDRNDKRFLAAFPYVALPTSPY
jgi:hypothetical protein